MTKAKQATVLCAAMLREAKTQKSAGKAEPTNTHRPGLEPGPRHNRAPYRLRSRLKAGTVPERQERPETSRRELRGCA